MTLLSIVSALSLTTACSQVGSPRAEEDSTLSAQQSDARRACVDKTIAHLGIDLSMNTEPKLIAEILRDDMYLDDLNSAHVLFKESLEGPVSLTPMLTEIRNAIIDKQPAISDFLCAALDANLITPVVEEKSKAVVSRIIHHTYLLNGLTLEMEKSHQFMADIQTHLLGKRGLFGIRSDLVGSLEDLKKLYGGRMFGPTKVISVDLVNDLYLKDRQRGSVTPAEAAGFKDGLKLNILEAAVTENMADFHDNALAGVALAAVPPKDVTLTQDTKALQWDYSQRWASLYETWNLAFITGNSTYLHLYYPKLLAPAVIAADPKTYMTNRATSLWASLNFRQFAALAKKPDVEIPNTKELAKLWGSVNRGYAEELAKEEAGKSLDALAPMLNITLEQIMEKIKLSLTAVPLSADEQRRLAALYADQ